MIKDIIIGIKTYFRAIAIIKKLNLWKFFLVPAIMGVVLGILLFTSVYSLADNIGSAISSYWPFDSGKGFVEGLSVFLGGFAILMIGIIIYKHVLMAISSPFMGPVSEKVEEHITGKKIIKKESKKESASILVRSIRINARNLLKELAYTLPLILLSIIPVVGLAATIAIFYVQSYFAGFGNMDITLERYLNYQDSKRFIKKNKGIAVGNGFIFTMMLFIPFVGIMLTLPISTVASTINTVERLQKE